MRALGRRAAALGIASLVGAACHTTDSTQGGVLLVVNIDGTLKVSDLSELRVEVDAPQDGGPSYYKQSFVIPKSLSAFPASVAIDSNGLATASAAIHLSLWSQANEIDARDYELVNIPPQAVTQFDVTFSRECSPGKTDCAPDETCCPIGTGPSGCSSRVVNGDEPTLTCHAAAVAVTDAGSDATVGVEAGALSDASALPDASFDAAVDASSEADDTPPLGYDGSIPCGLPCAEGATHCVNGACIAVPPSCAGGGAGAGFECGGFDGTQDCCATLDVPLTPTGHFYRDYDSTENPEAESNPATVSQFSLDVFEVTVGRFRKFVTAAVGSEAIAPWVPPPGSGKHTHLPGGGLNGGGDGGLAYETGWDSSWNSELPTTKAGWDAALVDACANDARPSFSTWTSDPGDYEARPIVCLDWYLAYAFCIWDGGFLPSATEWDFAASGGDEQRAYAWGDAVPQNNTNLAIYGCLYGNLAGTPSGECLGPQNIALVGTVPAGRALWGQLDMTGNALEWTFDLDETGYLTPCTDCANFSAGDQRILRGGGFTSVPNQLHNYYLLRSPPTQSDVEAGVRCARPPY